MRTDLPRLALWGLVGIVLLGVLVGASTSGAAYGAFNPSWDGGSSLRTLAEEQGTEAAFVRDTSEYDSLSNRSVAFVLSPDELYSANESARLRRFVERGGTLVVADDSTRSNALLESVGTSARVDGRVVRDEHRYYRGPALPLATNVTAPAALANQSNASVDGSPPTNATDLPSGIDRLTLNYGSVLRPGNATVLVSTSEFAYLDSNGNEELDDAETLASRPVATVESVGQGRVVVVSDSSALINAMLDREDNRAFAGALMAESDRVALDYSHSASLPPLASLLVTFRESLLFQSLVALSFVCVVAVFLRWPTLREHEPIRRLRTRMAGSETSVDARLTADDAATALRRRRPDWDADRIDRVAGALAGDAPRDPWRGTGKRHRTVDSDAQRDDSAR